ncbi:TonB-dependent receptor plug domain-containing protein [Sphingomonas bacterium]|uniref:TonB-dependent receptor plug domain-containing protein n=1 Tax=Sphingomonas bacterium TaxID=1895847 RepID=UPI0020C67327|nr:TonB-dependent receptor [Sphingomonas bacterium]
MVVTGSRIARPNNEAPNPITTLDAADIQQSGNTNITDFLLRVPALTASTDSTKTSGGNGSYGSFGQTGLNELNLRNLGNQRTLVLVDGRRHVSSEYQTAAVDISTIPTDLIQSVDVLTGAVGAVYGADGVTGVVNFRLKRDLEGVSVRSQFGISDQGDAASRFVSVAAGHNFGGGRGNVTLSYEFSGSDAVANNDRSFLRQDQRKYIIPNDAAATNTSLPANILAGDLHYNTVSPVSAVNIGGDAYPSYDGLGQPYNNGTIASYYAVGGEGTGVAGFYQGDILPRIRRNDVNLLTHYDFSDAFKLSLEGKFAQTNASTFGQYTETYYYTPSFGNPFIPASIRTAALAAGTTANGVTTPATIYVSRDNIDFGRQGEGDRRRTYRGVADASGRISDHATYDAYYEYGRTDVRITKLNDRLNKQYNDALDAVTNAAGQIVCNPANNPIAGCVPLNIFGPGPATAQQLAYFLVSDTSSVRITQQVANASVSGDFGQFFALPGGPVRFAFGGEYRRETSRFDPDPRLLQGLFYGGDEPSPINGTVGSFDVKEAFGELEAPLLKDRRFAQLLTVGAAGRYSSYSTVGGTSTWEFTGSYAPIRAITFRGSYGKSVRAPNIGELFQPTLGTSAFVGEPCTPANINNGTQYRKQNCTTTLAAVGAAPNANLQSANFIPGSSSGNPNLQPERATTWTAGVLLRPAFLRGFTASFDWYDITLNGAINTVDAGTLAGLCVDQPTVPNQFCNQFTRQQGTGAIVRFTVSPLNVAQVRTSGADLNLNWRLETAGAGIFNIQLIGGYLNRLDRIGIPSAPVANDVDQAFSPRWTANLSPTWTIGLLTVNYNLRWNDAVLAFSRNALANTPNIAAGRYLRSDALWQHDLQAQVALPSGFAFYAGVNNLTDQRPDPSSYATNVPISPLGRFFYTGVKLGFGRGARR